MSKKFKIAMLEIKIKLLRKDIELFDLKEQRKLFRLLRIVNELMKEV